MRYSASCNNLRVSLDSWLIIDYTIFAYGQKVVHKSVTDRNMIEGQY